MGNPLQKFWQLITTSNYQRTFSILVLLILIAAIPLTFYVATTRHDIRQRAAGHNPDAQACKPSGVYTPTEIGTDLSKDTDLNPDEVYQWALVDANGNRANCNTAKRCGQYGDNNFTDTRDNANCPQAKYPQTGWINPDTSNWCYGFSDDIPRCIQLKWIGPGSTDLAPASAPTATTKPNATNPTESPTPTSVLPTGTTFDCSQNSGFHCFETTCTAPDWIFAPGSQNQPTSCGAGNVCCKAATATPTATPSPTPIGSNPLGNIETRTTTITLSKGWNLISVPYYLTDNKIGAVFKNNIDKVYYYNNGAWTSSSLSNGKWSGDITTIEPGKGYWVKVLIDGDLTLNLAPKIPSSGPPFSFSLVQGWNLIGYVDNYFNNNPTTTPSRDRDSYLTRISGGWKQIYRYSPAQGFELAKPDAGFTSLESGRGYWIYMNKAATLALE